MGVGNKPLIHKIFLTEPSWPGEAGSHLLFFSPGTEPLGACYCSCFYWNLGCPGQNKSTLPEKEAWLEFPFDFTNILRRIRGLRLPPFFGGPLENFRQAFLGPYFPCPKRPSQRFSQSPDVNVLPFRTPRGALIRVWKAIGAFRTGEQAALQLSSPLRVLGKYPYA